MNVNFKRPFVGFDRKPLVKKDGSEIQMFEEVCMHLYNVDKLKGAPLTEEQKYRAYSLCMRIAANPSSVEMSTEDGTFVKGVCYDKMSSGAYGQVVDVIENILS